MSSFYTTRSSVLKHSAAHTTPILENMPIISLVAHRKKSKSSCSLPGPHDSWVVPTVLPQALIPSSSLPVSSYSIPLFYKWLASVIQPSAECPFLKSPPPLPPPMLTAVALSCFALFFSQVLPWLLGHVFTLVSYEQSLLCGRRTACTWLIPSYRTCKKKACHTELLNTHLPHEARSGLWDYKVTDRTPRKSGI